jgi:hypothetical protein
MDRFLYGAAQRRPALLLLACATTLLVALLAAQAQAETEPRAR